MYNSSIVGKEHTVTNNQHTIVSGWDNTVRGEINNLAFYWVNERFYGYRL